HRDVDGATRRSAPESAGVSARPPTDSGSTPGQRAVRTPLLRGLVNRSLGPPHPNASACAGRWPADSCAPPEPPKSRTRVGGRREGRARTEFGTRASLAPPIPPLSALLGGLGHIDRLSRLHG